MIDPARSEFMLADKVQEGREEGLVREGIQGDIAEDRDLAVLGGEFATDNLDATEEQEIVDLSHQTGSLGRGSMKRARGDQQTTRVASRRRVKLS